MFKSHDETSKQTIIKILVVSFVLGIGILIFDYVDTQVNFSDSILRNEAGQGNNINELIVEYEDNSKPLEVTVSEKELLPKEVDEAFEKAKKEIDKTYLGKNKSADNVQQDLQIKNSYVDGLIKASWQFDNYTLIRADGKINVENVPKAGEIVGVRVDLTYFDYQQTYGFSVIVKPFDIHTKLGKEKAISDALQKSDKKTITKSYMKLPKTAKGLKLKWKKKMEYRGVVIIFLGVISSVLILFSKKQEVQKNKQDRLKRLERDYPLIVSELSILMGAGMSFRGAIERICNSYKKKVQKNSKLELLGYEEIQKLYRQMTEGVGEVQAIENFGIRAGQKDYRRLAMMLTQSIKKGSKELLINLEKEEEHAFEMRKQKAIKAGEEASTKLLLPMGGMLLIVILILVVPALMQMNV